MFLRRGRPLSAIWVDFRASRVRWGDVWHPRASGTFLTTSISAPSPAMPVWSSDVLVGGVRGGAIHGAVSPAISRASSWPLGWPVAGRGNHFAFAPRHLHGLFPASRWAKKNDEEYPSDPSSNALTRICAQTRSKVPVSQLGQETLVEKLPLPLSRACCRWGVRIFSIRGLYLITLFCASRLDSSIACRVVDRGLSQRNKTEYDRSAHQIQYWIQIKLVLRIRKSNEVSTLLIFFLICSLDQSCSLLENRVEGETAEIEKQ